MQVIFILVIIIRTDLIFYMIPRSTKHNVNMYVLFHFVNIFFRYCNSFLHLNLNQIDIKNIFQIKETFEIFFLKFLFYVYHMNISFIYVYF